MNPQLRPPGLLQALRQAIAACAVALLTGVPDPAAAQSNTLMLANPNWNITLSDYGYADFLLDNTPGFEGREYLSGEWGTAVAYTVGTTPVAPQWLEPQWVFPDWTTNSNFAVISPISAVGVNADNLPLAESVIANQHLRVTLRCEMLDTVTGTPMGLTAASAAGTGSALPSNRYVLKQTFTVQNLTAEPVTGLQLFQLLHGLSSQRGLFDHRPHAGPLGEFRHDITLAGIDPWSAGPHTSDTGLEDYIGFHALATPDAFEIGHFGVAGNGVDFHSYGKPSEGVHLSVEDNWLHAPYLARLGTDWFQPDQPWVAGAQRWTLGNLAPNQTVSHEILLTILTGTKVTAGSARSGSCNGGSSVAGGIDYEFTAVSAEGTCFASFARADDAELQIRIGRDEFDEFTFPTPGRPAQLWKIAFTGSYTGEVGLTLGYDATLLPPDFDENTLTIYHFSGGAWQALDRMVDPVSHRLMLRTATLGTFALAIDAAAPSYAIAASAMPSNSGTVAGAGNFPAGAGITLVATAEAGYGFLHWTENDVVIGASPTLTFTAAADRTLAATFIALGDNHSITTSWLPDNGGTTSGGGAYALDSTATVSAAAAPGFKFSKWLLNGVELSTDNPYSFSVSGSLALLAKFKPVYTVVTSAQPAAWGETEADATYEAGELAKLKAIAYPGHAFVNWTQNGGVVSSQANFSLNVTDNCTLVANFVQGNRIDVAAQPGYAGTVSGGGIYPNGEFVTLSAAAKAGYLFTHWSEGLDPVVVVATSPSLSFTAATSRSLHANFIALPNISLQAPTPGTLMLAWPATADGWRLEESPDLRTWAESTRPFVIQGSNKQVLISEPGSTGFFRLAHP